MAIPKILHCIWVGDESIRPDKHILSWRDKHPDWRFRLWGNKELDEVRWLNRKHLDAMSTREWNGVADIMRWEILFEHGGVLVDADSLCINALPDWLGDCEAWCCWENELLRPGLLAAGYVGTEPRTLLFRMLIDEIYRKESVITHPAWVSVGPQHFTDIWRKLNEPNLTVLPSHFLIPRHYTGQTYTAHGPVYAFQEWGSTFNSYERICNLEKSCQG